jgi:hypothetical protein
MADPDIIPSNERTRPMPGWQHFEHMGLTELGENIEDLYAVFLAFGKEAFQIGEQSVNR